MHAHTICTYHLDLRTRMMSANWHTQVFQLDNGPQFHHVLGDPSKISKAWETWIYEWDELHVAAGVSIISQILERLESRSTCWSWCFVDSLIAAELASQTFDIWIVAWMQPTTWPRRSRWIVVSACKEWSLKGEKHSGQTDGAEPKYLGFMSLSKWSTMRPSLNGLYPLPSPMAMRVSLRAVPR